MKPATKKTPAMRFSKTLEGACLVPLLSLALGSSALGQSPAQIELRGLSGQCEGTDVRIKQLGVDSYVQAFFNGSMVVATDPGVKTIDSKRCTLDLTLKLEPGYRFDTFTFSVDGVYQVSDYGSVRLTVSNRIGNASPLRTTGFFSLAGGSNVQGELVPGGFSGAVSADQLDGNFHHCGAHIPVEVSLYATASQPSSDSSGMTLVQLDEGQSSLSSLPSEACQGAYCVGKLTVQKCP